MSRPPSVVKINKKGVVTYTSSIDRTQYDIFQLSRKAMSEVGKVLAVLVKNELQKQRGMKGHRRVIGRKGMKRADVLAQPPAAIYDVPRSKDELPHLDIGLTHGTWYGIEQELGSSKVRKKGALRNTVYDNIPLIIEIESQYLSALEDEAKVLNAISEEAYGG